MAIKKSISGMRGTIGGRPGKNLTPIDIVEMTSAYGAWLISTGESKKVVVGRDGRISGAIVSTLAINTLLCQGIDVVNLGLSTTPTVEMAVTAEDAGGGIIFSASHNPRHWNALKLLNHKGEFISQDAGKEILRLASEKGMEFSQIDEIGKLSSSDKYIDYHIDKILDLGIIDASLIARQNFHVVVDCINSTGAISIPPLLDRLGVTYELLNGEVSGEFAHDPEPIPKNLTQLSEAVKQSKANLGIAVDPDVDRLVLVCEDGSMFSEEYTIVAVADFVLSKSKGNTVSNLSSSRALADITDKHNGQYYPSAVGEVHVVNKMKEVSAVIGGEGNGGVIYPELHYGRDALVGIAMMLNHLSDNGQSLLELKNSYPIYHIVKEKINLEDDSQTDIIIDKINNNYLGERINMIDGLKIDFADGWIHIRSSNTEPVLRLIAESSSKERANSMISEVQNIIKEINLNQ